jgi:alkyldihydroxyacetonephosphate synthase
VYPTKEEHIVAALRIAEEHGLAVIPFGGGTSVVGGVEPLDNGHRAAITLDMRGMRGIIAIDDVSRTATIETGITGPELEARLGERGYTLGHFPQSWEYSTLGGWIAARASGHASIRYGKIEHMVMSLRVVTPRGIIETRRVPASAAGPDLDQVLLGSEGVLGVITQATVVIRPKPAVMDYRGLLFGSFGDGIAAIREMVQGGVDVAMARLSSPEETQAFVAMRHLPTSFSEKTKERLGRWLIARKGLSLETGCLMILGVEGDDDEPAPMLGQGARVGAGSSEATAHEIQRAALEICRRYGAFDLGRGTGRAWHADRFETPYLRDVLIDHGILVDTLETATTWDNLAALYGRVKAAIEQAITAGNVKPWVMCHVSHAYPAGAALYYTFLAKQIPGHEVEQWEAVKRAATDAIMQNGGTLSHHHGVGYEHTPWLEMEDGREGVEALRAIKQTLDPKGIMNPGKLMTSDEFVWGARRLSPRQYVQ